MAARAESLILVTPVPKRDKKEKTMANEQTNSTKLVTTEVFDLAEFENVTLGKEIQLPAKPTSFNDVQNLPGMTNERLMNIVYEGLVKEAEEQAIKDKNGWHAFSEDDTLEDELYEGKWADSEKKKAINVMILNFAKSAFGFERGTGKDPARTKRNNEAKEKAKELIKGNQAMLDAFSK